MFAAGYRDQSLWEPSAGIGDPWVEFFSASSPMATLTHLAKVFFTLDLAQRAPAHGPPSSSSLAHARIIRYGSSSPSKNASSYRYYIDWGRGLFWNVIFLWEIRHCRSDMRIDFNVILLFLFFIWARHFQEVVLLHPLTELLNLCLMA